MNMDEKKYALLIIDMQNDFVLPGAPACVAEAAATIPILKRLLDHFRTRRLPVFHIVREYRADGSDIEITRLEGFVQGQRYAAPGTPGCEIVDDLTPIDGEYRVVKNRFSAFMNTELDFMLRRLAATHLVVCGTQYPNCIRATIFDAVAYGYPVINITDATSAQTHAIADSNILDLRNIGVECVLCDEFLSQPNWLENEFTSSGRPDGIVIREGFHAMDFERVRAWLAATYWSPGIAQETVERAARNSALVIGAFAASGVQVGYGRVVSDCTRFAYLADIIVDESRRGMGIGRAMVRFALNHPEMTSVRKWTLATRDAHGVYAPLGFGPITEFENKPESWMIRRLDETCVQDG